ncbi:DNA repair protein RadC [Agromyces fucosus]|uniref:DNA repair protein RadC n=1 Tax=Agromyces fucosus TaxID=41985 RepID=A0A4Q2JHB8_9MICO|nr:DNA repair protein RadC [Agromyces fucosus]RXZ47355.1 DNA repair protein RadC [Agromyces fucosus]
MPRLKHDLPRERLLRLGSAALTDAELVAIQLGTGSSGESVRGLAEHLLTTFGGVAGLARARIDELVRVAGVGPAKASRLVAAFALADRAERPELGAVITGSGDIAALAIASIGREREERVLLIVVDGANRVRASIVVAQGTQSGCSVPVREVLSHVLRHDGAAFALAHNHPSGRIEPSDGDRFVTTRIADAAAEVGLRLLDHVVVSGRRWRSVTASR